MSTEPIILPDDPRDGAVPMCPPNLKRIVLEEHGPQRQPRAFPRHFFPAPIERLVEAIAASKGAAYELAALPMMAGVSTGLGKDFTVDVQGCQASARLWLASVAPPGSAKTPTAMSAIAPLELAHEREWEEFQALQAEHERRLAAKAERKRGELPPQAPVFAPVLSMDTTSEKLLEDLARCERGHMLLLNELSGLLTITKGGVKKGESGGGRLLQCWDGASMRVSRKGAGEIWVKKPFLTLYGSTPESVLAQLGLENNDGAAARFLWARPHIIPSGLGRVVPESIARDWRRVCERARGIPKYHTSLTGSAVEYVDAFTRDSKEQAQELERLGRGLLGAVLGKGLEQFVRLLALAHGLDIIAHELFEEPVARIESAAERVFDVLEFFFEHAVATLGPLSPSASTATRGDADLLDRLRTAAKQGPEEDSPSGWSRRLEALGVETRGPKALGRALTKLSLVAPPDMVIARGSRCSSAKSWIVRILNGAVSPKGHVNGTPSEPTAN